MGAAALNLARRAASIVAGTLAVVGAAAAAENLIAKGGCRDGQPNGLYELRTADGNLRIVGAFAKGRRTGTFVFWDAKGARIAVVPYDDDVKVGTVAVWYDPAIAKAEPPRKSEVAYADGVLHGSRRSWHPNGRPRTDLRYEHGVLVEARAWTAAGVTLPDAQARKQAEQDVAADDSLYANLEKTIAEHPPRCD